MKTRDIWQASSKQYLSPTCLARPGPGEGCGHQSVPAPVPAPPGGPGQVQAGPGLPGGGARRGVGGTPA